METIKNLSAKLASGETSAVALAQGNETAAKNVGELIRCTNIKQIDSTTEEKDYTSEAKVDFTIILGKDFNGRYVVRRSSN